MVFGLTFLVSGLFLLAELILYATVANQILEVLLLGRAIFACP
jgi:hypothetical protein